MVGELVISALCMNSWQVIKSACILYDERYVKHVEISQRF